MPLRKTDKPALSNWIVEQRKRMGLKPDSLAAELTRLGYEVAVATVRGWEAGARPGPEGIETLERLFGQDAPGEQPVSDQSAIVEEMRNQTAAINRQAAALEALVAKLGDLALGQIALAEEVGRAIDPETARRYFEESQTETPSERSRRGKRPPDRARPWEEQQSADVSRGSGR